MKHSYLECDGCKKTDITSRAEGWFVLSAHDGRPYPIGKEPIHMCPRCYERFTNLWEELNHRPYLMPKMEYKDGGDAA